MTKLSKPRDFVRGFNIYHDESPHSAAMNMAIDEALLEAAVVPTIRFYRWRSPALSFGYFGKFPMWRFTRQSAI